MPAKHRPNSVGQATDVDLGLSGATFKSAVENSAAAAVSRVRVRKLALLKRELMGYIFLRARLKRAKDDPECAAEYALSRVKAYIDREKR
jgi:hypothetical protein